MPYPTLRAFTLALLSMMAQACGAPCTNQIVESATSPGNQLRAVVFQRDCGSGTPKQTHVSVIPARSSDPDGEGNALVLEPARPDSVAARGDLRITLEWLERDRLRVSYRPDVRVVKSVRSVSEVRVEYVPLVGNGPIAFLPRSTRRRYVRGPVPRGVPLCV